MVRKEISPMWLIGAAVVMVGLVGFWLFRASGPDVPPSSSYTPGVPPWLEKDAAKNQSGVQAPPSAQQAPPGQPPR